MANELKNTLLINNDEFNINAKHAEEASKVVNQLEFKKINLTKNSKPNTDDTTSTYYTYDGSEDVNLIVVPAEGGRFSGRITVPSSTENTWLTDGETVLNYNDIKNTVIKELKNNSVLYEWNGTTLSGGGDSAQIKSVSIITGPDSAANSFANKNFSSKQFSAFIYVADNGNIYFGTSDSNKIVGVRVSADSAITANQLANSRDIITNLGHSNKAAFNGTANIEPGVIGVLSPVNGGTGTKSLDNVTVGKAKQLETARRLYVDFSKSTDTTFNGSKDVGISTSGILSPDKGGTGKTTLTDVTVGNATKFDNKFPDFYQKKITISTSSPSGGVDGDIWIKY